MFNLPGKIKSTTPRLLRVTIEAIKFNSATWCLSMKASWVHKRFKLRSSHDRSAESIGP